MKRIERILVVGPSWVGDMVMAQSLFIALRHRFPSALIDVLAPPWSLPLIARMPEVARGIAMEVGHGKLGLASRYRLGRKLRDRFYHRAILLPNSLKSALVPFWAEIPIRTGFVGEQRYGLLNDLRRLDKKALPRTVQRFVALAADAEAPLPDPIPQPRLSIEPDDQQAALARLEIKLDDAPLLALCPGAEYGPAKQWPASHYAEVAQAKLAEGWRVWIFGSTKDRAVGEEVRQSAPAAINLAGRTELKEAIDLLALADAVVSNDSGLMHLAAALDCKVVALYGSSDPGFTPPMHPEAEILTLNLECSPCFKRTCPKEHLDCLQKLEPARVLSLLPTAP